MQEERGDDRTPGSDEAVGHTARGRGDLHTALIELGHAVGIVWEVVGLGR